MFRPYEKTTHIKKSKQDILCVKCGKEPITNKFHQLGENCMFEKTHGMSKEQNAKNKAAVNLAKAKERQKLKPIAPSVPKTKIAIFSENGAKKHAEITATKKKVIQKAIDNDCLGCVNCVSHDYTNSHILSVAMRPDLAADENNIQLLCVPCHSIFEHGTIEEVIKMRSFMDAARYIHDNDTGRFNKLLFKVLDFYAKSGDKFTANILRQFEAFQGNDSVLQ